MAARMATAASAATCPSVCPSLDRVSEGTVECQVGVRGRERYRFSR